MDPEQNSPYTPWPIEHSTQLRVQQRQPSSSSSGFGDNGGRPQTQSSATEKHLLGDDSSQGHSPARDRNNPHADFGPVPQAPVNVPDLTVEDPKPWNIKKRLEPTIENAKWEKKKAQLTCYLLNIATGLQILVGALTTGLAASLSGRQVSIAITILGAMSTIMASYLTRARGLNEPELSNTRAKDLDEFLRTCNIFETDHGHEHGTTENRLNDRLRGLRKRFDEILRNTDGQQKLSLPIKAGDERFGKLGNADGQQKLFPPIKAGDERFEKFIGNVDGQQKLSPPIKAAR